MSDFLESMKKMKKSVSGDTLLGYEAWNQKFGEGAPQTTNQTKPQRAIIHSVHQKTFQTLELVKDIKFMNYVIQIGFRIISQPQFRHRDSTVSFVSNCTGAYCRRSVLTQSGSYRCWLATNQIHFGWDDEVPPDSPLVLRRSWTQQYILLANIYLILSPSKIEHQSTYNNLI